MIRRSPIIRRTPLKRTGLKRRVPGSDASGYPGFVSFSMKKAKVERGLIVARIKRHRLPNDPKVLVFSMCQMTLDREKAARELRKHMIRPRSKKRQADERKYAKAKAEHFAENPRCQYPGVRCPREVGSGHVMDLHHKAGRNGPLLYCKKYFATACRMHHDVAKSCPRASLAMGWIVKVSSDEVRALREAEL